MMRSLLIALLFACLAPAAQAQLRTIPAEAKRGSMSPVEGMIVEIDGRRFALAAGAQIRDGRNMIVVPNMLPSNVLVKYLRGPDGKIYRVWLLSPQEAAQPDPPQ
jgi:hypothetical protein